MIEQMNKAWTDIAKANKASTTMASKAMAVFPKSAKFSQHYHDLQKCLEGIEGMHGDLGFLIRFRKSRDGQSLTATMAKQVLGLCAIATSDLIDSAKTMKAMMPKEVKEEY